MQLIKKLTAIAAITVLYGSINLSTNANRSIDENSNPHYKLSHANLESKLKAEENKPAIILNPGHDNTFVGYSTKGYKEEILNLELSKKLEMLLAERDYNVLLMRSSESGVNKDSLDINNDKKVNRKDELLARANYVKNNTSDCVIIVHHNAYPNSSRINGTEIYFYGVHSRRQLDDKKLNFTRPEHCRIYSESSKNVAEKLTKYMNEKGMKATTYGSDMLELIETPTRTAIYLEARCLTNPDDLEKAITEEGQMETAKLISDFFKENKEYLSSLKQDSSNLKIIKQE